VAVLLDTSVLIAAEKGPDEDAAISVVRAISGCRFSAPVVLARSRFAGLRF
jgi:hypothetical protein